jgi:hypothetical protein
MKYPFLNQCYITLLEIGGSHAHRLRPLIEELGLSALIITDLDPLTKTGGTSVQCAPKSGYVTNNTTLKNWLPGKSNIDELFAVGVQKVAQHDPLFAVRVAYQTPLKITIPGTSNEQIAYPYTFEDALAFENLDFFSTLDGFGLVRKFREAIAEEKVIFVVAQRMYDALKTGKKAEFALDIIDAEAFNILSVPQYIAEGLEWLERQLKKKQVEILTPTKKEVGQ